VDAEIIDGGIADCGPISGFQHGLMDEAGGNVVTVWVPVLGASQGPQLSRIYEFLEPDDVFPVLPFPSRNPRRGDEIVMEHRELLIEHMRVEPRNYIYAHESNPFDLYRQVTRLSDRYAPILEPLGVARVVASVHASKVLSLGVLLAAIERQLPVVHAVATDYIISPAADLLAFEDKNEMMTLWLAGDPYR
jgi:hypothetical protein